MEDTKIKVLINEEKYEDAIDLMQEKYIYLFKQMLNFKKAEYPKNEDFNCYTLKIMNEYPNFIEQIEFLRNGINNESISYLNEMDLLRNVYSYLDKNYNKVK